jgi:mono/diheme cytochrome c family protein
MLMIPKPFRILGYPMVVALLFSCSPKQENADDRSPKFQQYYVQGQTLYQQYCSNCHQANGKGLGRLYPPVDQSDFMENNFDEVICTIKYGKQGILIVNGDDYNMEMKGNPGLTELEIAEIVTYVYNTWSHKKGLVDVNEVSRILANCVH